MARLFKICALIVLAAFVVLAIYCDSRTYITDVYSTEVDGTRLTLVETFTVYPGVRSTCDFHARLSGPGGEWTAPLVRYQDLPWPGPSRWGRRVALRRPEGSDSWSTRRVLFLDPAKVDAEQFEAWRVHLATALPDIDAAFDGPRDGQSHANPQRQLRLVGLHHLDWEALTRRYECGERRWLQVDHDGTVGAYQGQPLGKSASFSRVGQVFPDGRTARLSEEFLGLAVQIDWPDALQRCRCEGRLLGDDFDVQLVDDRFPRVPERDWETGRELRSEPTPRPPSRDEPRTRRRNRRRRVRDRR